MSDLSKPQEDTPPAGGFVYEVPKPSRGNQPQPVPVCFEVSAADNAEFLALLERLRALSGVVDLGQVVLWAMRQAAEASKGSKGSKGSPLPEGQLTFGGGEVVRGGQVVGALLPQPQPQAEPSGQRVPYTPPQIIAEFELAAVDQGLAPAPKKRKRSAKHGRNS